MEFDVYNFYNGANNFRLTSFEFVKERPCLTGEWKLRELRIQVWSQLVFF